MIAGPIEDGVIALGRGDYATAETIFLPLADHGDAQARSAPGGLMVLKQTSSCVSSIDDGMAYPK